jgi:hypothetical protein
MIGFINSLLQTHTRLHLYTSSTALFTPLQFAVANALGFPLFPLVVSEKRLSTHYNSFTLHCCTQVFYSSKHSSQFTIQLFIWNYTSRLLIHNCSHGVFFNYISTGTITAHLVLHWTATAYSFKPLELTYWRTPSNCCLVAKAWRHCCRGHATAPLPAPSKVFTAVAWRLVHGWIGSAFLGSLRLCLARYGENTSSSTIA